MTSRAHRKSVSNLRAEYLTEKSGTVAALRDRPDWSRTNRGSAR